MNSPRTSRPGAGNKYFIRKANGGYSSCIQGKPTDKNCNVLANCVGYACGAFNEEHSFGYEKYHLNCNAENFIERAVASKLSVYQKPMVGGIIVWQKGSLSSSDGAGHVAIVTWVNDPYNPTQIKTAESGYGSSSIFWNSTRNIGSGNWGQNSQYKYRGCIAPEGYKPPVPTKTIDELAHEVIEGKWGNGEERKRRLTEAGYDYAKVQARVNEILSGKKYIQLTANVWCRLNGYGFKYAKYKVIPMNTKCELLSKNVGKANGYNWDKVIYNGKTVYLPNKWNKYL